MEFDFAHIKAEARARMKQARPQPWKVTGIYLMLIIFLPIFLYFLVLAALILSPLRRLALHPNVLSAISVFSASLALLLPMALFQTGYLFYSIKVWRREPVEYRDLLRGSAFPGKVLALWGRLLLFALLWCLSLFLPMALSRLLFHAGLDSPLWNVLTLFLLLGAYVFMFSRMLLYLFSVHVMLDHPDYTARQAMDESKALMLGQRWKLVLFFLSFAGWYLLEYLIVYAAALVGVLTFFVGLMSNPSEPTTVLLLILFVLFPLCAMCPLLLYLAPYINVSLAGLYDTLQGKPLIPPQPPWQTGPEL